MFKNILVPLDGSKLAEATLPAAAWMAQKLNAPVTLLHIIEQDPPQNIHSDHHITQPAEAETYLKDVIERTFPKKVKTDWHVHSAAVKDIPASIVEHATTEFQPDLIIMCTHGDGGFRDLFYGNIAQQVVALGKTPLLLIKPKAVSPESFKLEKILIPLDTGTAHDDSIAPALNLARKFKTNIHLLTVIPTLSTVGGQAATTSNLLPGTTSALLDISAENAEEDLQGHLEELIDAGVEASAEVVRGDPATEIVNTAEKSGADLIVLSTHRKAGAAAFWARSVAPKVANRSNIPILLIPIG